MNDPAQKIHEIVNEQLKRKLTGTIVIRIEALTGGITMIEKTITEKVVNEKVK